MNTSRGEERMRPEGSRADLTGRSGRADRPMPADVFDVLGIAIQRSYPMRRIITLIAVTLMLLGGLVVAATPGVAQTPPPGLADEVLSSSDFLIQGTCRSLDFSIFGDASGPYAGSFYESGAGSMGVFGLGGIGTLTTEFSISAPNGTITGTKSYGETSSTIGSSHCIEEAFGGPTQFEINAVNLQFSATIQTTDGQTCTTTGTSNVHIVGSTDGSSEFFEETFLSNAPLSCTGGGGDDDSGEDPPADPVTMDDCKDGGWEVYGFKNQGQCNQFVNTGKDSRS